MVLPACSHAASVRAMMVFLRTSNKSGAAGASLLVVLRLVRAATAIRRVLRSRRQRRPIVIVLDSIRSGEDKDLDRVVVGGLDNLSRRSQRSWRRKFSISVG